MAVDDVVVLGRDATLRSGRFVGFLRRVSEVQFPIFGFFLFIVAALVLLITSGHHDKDGGLLRAAALLRARADRFGLGPRGGLVLRHRMLLVTGLSCDGIAPAAHFKRGGQVGV